MHLFHASKAILILTLTIMLAACGNAAGGNNAAGIVSSTPEPSVSPTTEADALTKKVQTIRGEVEIPTNPKRIVTEGFLPELLVLGAKPVGAPSWELENKVIQNQIDGIESTGEGTFEAILALEPDLIITWVNETNIVEQYEKIAPTIVITSNHFDGVHEKLRYLGAALGKEANAEQWLSDFDHTVETSRAQLAEITKPGDTFSLMGVFVVNKGFYIYADGEYRGGEAIYRHLQLTPPEKQKQEMIGKESHRKISYEVISEYAGDYIFLDQGEMISEVWGDKEAVWKSLDAVKNDRVLKLDPDLFWGNDALSLKLQIQEVVKMLTEKAK